MPTEAMFIRLVLRVDAHVRDGRRALSRLLALAAGRSGRRGSIVARRDRPPGVSSPRILLSRSFVIDFDLLYAYCA